MLTTYQRDHTYTSQISVSLIHTIHSVTHIYVLEGRVLVLNAETLYIHNYIYICRFRTMS